MIKRGHDVTWENQLQSEPLIGINELLLMVGPTRQILLWRPSHFRFFKRIVDCWTLSEVSFSIRSTVRGHASMQLLASGAGLVLQPKPGPQANELFQQIDPVEMDDPQLIVRHRCGVLTQTHVDSVFRSSYELVLLTLISFVLDRQISQATIDLNGMSGK